MDLIDVLNVLWRSKWIILTVTIIVTAAAASQALNEKPVYQAETIMVVGSLSPSGRAFSNEDITAASYADLANTPPVLEKAFGVADPNGAGNVPAQVVASSEKDSPYLRLTGTGSDPQGVIEATNAVATALMQQVMEVQAGIIDDSKTRIQDELTAVEKQLVSEQSQPVVDSSRISALQSYRQALLKQNEELALQVSQGPNLTVVSSAVESHRVPANPLRSTFLGFAIGLFSGIVVGFVYDSVRRAITGGREARETKMVHQDSSVGLETTD